jgi:hypothetical protein
LELSSISLASDRGRPAIAIAFGKPRALSFSQKIGAARFAFDAKADAYTSGS